MRDTVIEYLNRILEELDQATSTNLNTQSLQQIWDIYAILAKAKSQIVEMPLTSDTNKSGTSGSDKFYAQFHPGSGIAILISGRYSDYVAGFGLRPQIGREREFEKLSEDLFLVNSQLKYTTCIDPDYELLIARKKQTLTELYLISQPVDEIHIDGSATS